MSPSSRLDTRRDFLKKSAFAAGLLATAPAASFGARNSGASSGDLPWYRRTLRWGQTNITEIDPTRYDIEWWRTYWKRTHTQGLIFNAGGIVSYYPSQIPLHRPAQQLGGRDIFGDLCRAAQQDGIVVLARMDSNRAHEEFYQAHPDWFAVDSEGRPHKAGELFVSCVNSPYYEQHIPAILSEIAERYHPDGFTDNSWSGLGRATICYCKNCQTSFLTYSGKDIPSVKDWNDPAYRQWIRWNYDRRLQIWDLNNRTTKAAGGPHCIWAGMNSGSVTNQAQTFRDYKAICEKAEIIMLDHQARSDASGFQHNGEAGKLIHGILGWPKLIPESMAMYQAGRPTFRLASKPAAEARMWMIDGIAGGLQPWWHHVSAYHEDRRMYDTAEPIYRWHRDHQQLLVNRKPLATVGVLWSQQNTDFYGRDDADLLVDQPWRGITQALIRARIPYVPVHLDHLQRDAAELPTIILPNLGAMSDAQLSSIRRFVEAGGGLLATGQVSLFDEFGDKRPDFGLADLFKAHTAGAAPDKRADTAHTYLRLHPELRARVNGPQTGDEPAISRNRHETLRGFEKTDILSYGGTLGPLKVDPGAEILMTFIPSFPIYPPETAWMRTPATDLPGLILNTTAGARIAYLPADIDRRFARENLPDHGDLLANLIRWTARDNLPLTLDGPGLLDCHLYTQPGRLILHIVNLTSAATWRQPIHELIPIGPLRLNLKAPPDVDTRRVRLLVAGKTPTAKRSKSHVEVEIPNILDHEVIVVGRI